MNDLALLAQKTIANWSRARFRARLDAMERSFQLWKNEAVSLAGAAGTNLVLYQNARENMMLQQQQQQQQKAIAYSRDGLSQIDTSKPDRHQFNIAPMDGNAHAPQPELYISKPPKNTDVTENIVQNGEAEPSLETKKPDIKSGESYHTAPVSLANKQKIYDISTRLVGDSLELTLVYILRLNLTPHKRASLDSTSNGSQPSPMDDTDSVRSLSLVSSFGLPSPEPAFDAVLHMKALRSEEGGLLYQNPRADEMRSGERMPQSEEVEYAVSHGSFSPVQATSDLFILPVCPPRSSL